MQKITLKERASELRRLMLSDGIVEYIMDLHSEFNDSSIDSTNRWNSNKQELITAIVNTKSNFDNIVEKNSEYKLIGDSLENQVYDTSNVTKVISILAKTNKQDKTKILTNRTILDFLSFHKSIIGLDEVTQNTVTEDVSKENIVLFTILSIDNPTSSTVISVLKAIQELIDTIEKIYDEEQTNRIYILDKGSNTNIGFETGIKTAGSIFKIFKEVWDWIVNRKYYKEKLKNASFIENLGIIQQLHSMKEEGSLSSEDSLRYKTVITRNIDKLLNLDTIPRELAKLKEGESEDILLLKDYSEIRMLEKGKDKSDS